LEPGQYALRIRAIGYELDDPGTVEVAPHKPASADLKLHKAKDLASQLTNAEWIMSVPGTTVDWGIPREQDRDVRYQNRYSTTPTAFWVGSNHGASIVKLDPLD
jgi:hypothetical protein